MATSRRSTPILFFATAFILITGSGLLALSLLLTSTPIPPTDDHSSCLRPYGPRFKSAPTHLDCPTDYEASSNYVWRCHPLRHPTPLDAPYRTRAHRKSIYVYAPRYCLHSLILLQFASIRNGKLRKDLEAVRIEYYYKNTLVDFSVCNPVQSKYYSNLGIQLTNPNRTLVGIPVCTQAVLPCQYGIDWLLERYRYDDTDFTDCPDEIKATVTRYYHRYKFPPAWP